MELRLSQLCVELAHDGRRVQRYALRLHGGFQRKRRPFLEVPPPITIICGGCTYKRFELIANSDSNWPVLDHSRAWKRYTALVKFGQHLQAQ